MSEIERKAAAKNSLLLKTRKTYVFLVSYKEMKIGTN